MKKLFVTLVLACIAVCSYAQKDIPAGGSMEVASVESGESFNDAVGLSKQITMYKVKDDEGNPSFLLYLSNTRASILFGTEDSSTSFTIPSGGIVLDFGTTYEEALDKLNELIDFYAEKDGAQMELTGRDGSKIVCTLNKGLLGKSLSIGETSLTKSDAKSLRTGLKLSKKLHRDL